MRGTILVVDDNFDARNILDQFLTAYGYEVHLADDGDAALARLQGDVTFDAVVLDLLMPRMSGYEVMRAMKNLPPRARDVPVVVTSAASKYFFGTATAVFPKPTPLMDLLRVIDGIVGGGPPRAVSA